MINRTLKSESGFGLVQAVAALFIVTIAIAGLFMASYIARHQALGNYHYRVALLRGLTVLEELKSYNKDNSFHIEIPTGTFNGQLLSVGEFVLDDEYGEIVKGKVANPVVRTSVEYIISPYVRYDKVTIKVSWTDGPRYFGNSELNNSREITLREDYFYRTDQPGT